MADTHPVGGESPADDPHDLNRFIEAQQLNYGDALAELANGHKITHWMWYVFPQHVSLGRSEMARFYGLGSVEEARAYARHPLLGARLRRCVELVLAVQGRTLREIFGPVDALKFCSSMEIFSEADPDEPLFRQARARYC